LILKNLLLLRLENLEKEASVIAMKEKISASLMAASIILMALPSRLSTVISVNHPPILDGMSYQSPYFSLPASHSTGNWLPVLTAAISIVALYFFIFGVLKRTTQVLVTVCIIMSFLSWYIHFSLNVLGVMITVLHTITLLLQFRQGKKEVDVSE